MKHPFIWTLAAAFGLASFAPASFAGAPKRILVVTTTTGFRHSSIPTAEKVLSDLAEQTHIFTVEFIQQPPGKPNPPSEPAAPASDASEEQLAAFRANEERYSAEKAAYETAEAAWESELKRALAKLSPAALKDYDGVIFANTTGDLPIPDREGFLAWIQSGKAFIGMHAATDTFHGWPAFIDMLGGEFKQHGPQVGVDCLNEDPQSPATCRLGKVWHIQQEEIYQFKNYDPARVHELLALNQHPNDRTPGHYPVSWQRTYGRGRIFYTSLGHREDIWDADPNLKDRRNPVEISKAYQAHILGGIEWALGLDAAPGKPR